MNFRRYVVDAVGEEIIPRQRDERGRLGKIEELLRLRPTGGIDVADALRHDLRLGLPDRGMQRDKLAVEIALLHPVLVDEDERPHARPRERFRTPAPHAAQPEYGHAAFLKFFRRPLAQNERGTAKLLLHASIIVRPAPFVKHRTPPPAISAPRLPPGISAPTPPPRPQKLSPAFAPRTTPATPPRNAAPNGRAGGQKEAAPFGAAVCTDCVTANRRR